jgi:hypothetical protein
MNRNQLRYHRFLSCVALVLLVAGCGRKSPPVARPNGTMRSAAQATSSGPVGIIEPEGPEARKTLDAGRTAGQLGQTLQSNNPSKREEAAQALRSMGEAGYPQLRDALKDRSPEVRLKAIQSIDLPVLRSHQEEMVVMLLTLLTDPNPAVREEAAARLVAFDTTGPKGSLQAGVQLNQRIQALQYAALNDPAPNVRLAAVNSLQCIQSAGSGKVGKD